MDKKNIGLLLAVLIGILLFLNEQGLLTGEHPSSDSGRPPSAPLSDQGVAAIAAAYRAQRGDIQVMAEGVVTKVLRDDLDGSRHQRFLLRLANGQTLLVAHNIDLAPRIDDLRAGDSVAFYGEYEWNNQGGVIHWTHHDPAGRHVDGWLRHRGQTYQ